MGYKEDLEIDEHDLVNELTGQALLYMKYGEKAAFLRAKRIRLQEKVSLIKGEAKKELDFKKAVVETTIRQSAPSDFGYEKMTEGTVNAVLNQDEDYKAAITEHGNTIEEAIIEYSDCVQEHSIMETATEAFVHRKSALENIVKLFLGGYFGDPNIPREDLTPATTRAAVKRQTKAISKDKKKRTLKKRKKDEE